jgi:hypothetical protein
MINVRKADGMASSGVGMYGNTELYMRLNGILFLLTLTCFIIIIIAAGPIFSSILYHIYIIIHRCKWFYFDNGDTNLCDFVIEFACSLINNYIRMVTVVP